MIPFFEAAAAELSQFGDDKVKDEQPDDALEDEDHKVVRADAVEELHGAEDVLGEHAADGEHLGGQLRRVLGIGGRQREGEGEGEIEGDR